MANDQLIQDAEVGTELVVAQQGGELVSAEEQAAQLAKMMADDAGDGFENVGMDDVAIPFFKLLQKGSPECEEGNTKFMADAKPGFVLDSVSRALIDVRSTVNKFALVIPVHYAKVICVWRPNQGGKVGESPFDQKVLDAATRKETPDGGIILVNDDGNTVEETAKYYVLLVSEDGGFHWGIMALSGSKLGASKKWLSLVKGKKVPGTQKELPMYSSLYRVSSYLETSKRTGKTYQQFRFEDGGRITNIGLYEAAKNYRKEVLAGKVKEHQEAAPDGAGGEGASDDNVPF